MSRFTYVHTNWLKLKVVGSPCLEKASIYIREGLQKLFLYIKNPWHNMSLEIFWSQCALQFYSKSLVSFLQAHIIVEIKVHFIIRILPWKLFCKCSLILMYAVCYVLKSGVEKWINPTYKGT